MICIYIYNVTQRVDGILFWVKMLLFDTIFIGSKNMTQFWSLPCWVTHSWVTWSVGSSEPHNTSYWVFRSHFGSSGLKWAPQHKLLRFSIHYCHRVLLPFTGFRVYATSWLHCVPRSGSDLIDFVLYLLDSCICNGLLVSGLSVGIWHQHGWRGQQGPRPAVATWLWLGVWWLPRSTSNPVDRRCLECFDEFNSQTVSYAIPPFRQQCAGTCASAQQLHTYWPKIYHGRTGMAATALCSSCQLHRVPTLCSPVWVVRTRPGSYTGSATCPGNLPSAHVSTLCLCFSSRRTVWAFGHRPVRGDLATGG